jgi:hypothetical protein
MLAGGGATSDVAQINDSQIFEGKHFRTKKKKRISRPTLSY